MEQQKLDELKVEVKLVVFDSDFLAKAYAGESKLQWPILIDKNRELYSAYGMVRGSWWDIYNPVSIVKYIGLILRGQKPGRPGKDWRQLGGDILIDPLGIVQLYYVSTDPHDRPSIASIFEKVEQSQSNY